MTTNKLDTYWCDRAEEFLTMCAAEEITVEECHAALQALGLPFEIEQVRTLAGELEAKHRILIDPDAYFYAVAEDMGAHPNVGPEERWDFAQTQADQREEYVAAEVRKTVAQRRPYLAVAQ